MKDGNNANGIPTNTPSSLVKSSSAGSYFVKSKPAVLARGVISSHAPWKLARPALPTGPTMSGALPAAMRARRASYEFCPLLYTTLNKRQYFVWDLLYLSTNAFSLTTSGGLLPEPRPTNQLT